MWSELILYLAIAFYVIVTSTSLESLNDLTITQANTILSLQNKISDMEKISTKHEKVLNSLLRDR